MYLDRYKKEEAERKKKERDKKKEKQRMKKKKKSLEWTPRMRGEARTT